MSLEDVPPNLRQEVAKLLSPKPTDDEIEAAMRVLHLERALTKFYAISRKVRHKLKRKKKRRR